MVIFKNHFETLRFEILRQIVILFTISNSPQGES